MSLIIGILTVVLVLTCLFLMLLILIQLPKKEAGAGLAFGAGTTDALFGAGSGTALTKITKYACGVFFGLALLLAVLNNYRGQAGGRQLQDLLQKEGAAPTTTEPASAGSPAPGTEPMLSIATATNLLGTTNPPAVTPVPPAAAADTNK